MQQDGHLTPDQLAERWHITRSSLAQQRYLGTGPRYLKVGRRVLYPLDSVVEFERANTVEPGAA
ncbi:DNA-binding protein [Nocardia puris]|uniref:DNA-binding protein n=1 Tax=Nocardia puris TaxID=208602 RepID=UPI0018958F5D|nr:DNA-binding protein [Nocardia puris]MBF6213819.1 DNA-binding protein [Nocardia puris]